MRITSIVSILCLALIAQSAHAATRGALDAASKPDMSKHAVDTAQSESEKAAGVARVEEYLAGLSSVVANFSQTSTDGSTGTGKFFMKRPGKMRWQYNPPTPILLVSDGKTVTYYDAGLDQVTYIGVDDILAGFLAKKVIKLDGDSTKLTRFEVENGLVRVTLVQTKKPSEGSLTLEFSDKPLEIKNIIAVDATGNETRVTLENPQFGPVLDDTLFVYEDSRGVNRKRNKK